MKKLARISAAVRHALGKATLPALAMRAHEASAEAEEQKRQDAERRLPQPLRLWLIARRKRTCAKRRHGDSAKSPAANRKPGLYRLGNPTGFNTYAERDRRIAELLRQGYHNASKIAKKELG